MFSDQTRSKKEELDEGWEREREREEKLMAVFCGLKFSLCFVGDGDG